MEIASSVVIEDIEMDRPWVCAGEPVRAWARTGGELEPGAVYRWAWMSAANKAELQPGPAMQWTAPQGPGRYALHFQVCKDLGGRRVGLLAERVVEIEVRSCAETERQAHELLRIRATQRRHGVFAFQAMYQGKESIEEYAWDLGDGAIENTNEPFVEHTYLVPELGLHDVQSFAVTLEARSASGARVTATTTALVRGQPPTAEPLPVELEISRWRPGPDGHGWQSDVMVMNPAGLDITWDRLERVTKYFDDHVDMVTRAWSDVIAVEESLDRGGFRGRVTVQADEVGPDVKQIIDFLYGHDAAGEEIMVSWTPFKRDTPPSPDAAARPPSK